ESTERFLRAPPVYIQRRIPDLSLGCQLCRRQHSSGLYTSSRRQRIGINEHGAADDAYSVCRNFIGERRRGTAIFWSILVSVPGTRNAAVDDLSFPKWPVLVPAHVGYRGHKVAVSKD